MSELVESFSGIRGIWGESLNKEVALDYAASFLSILQKESRGKNLKIVIGRDTRPSGEELTEIFANFFMDGGCEVLDIGVASTPATENAVRSFGADGGLIITASHNPPEYNGFKFLQPSGGILTAAEAGELIQKAQEKVNIEPKDGGSIKDAHSEAIKDYCDFVLDLVGLKNIKQIKSRNFKILFDAGGGAIIPVIKEVVKMVGIEAICKNMDQGVFNRQIEPTAESMAYLVDVLKQEGADFAVGFDADADRAEIVLPGGEMISGQYVVAMLTDAVLSDSGLKNQTIVVNDATSDLIYEIAKKHQAKVEEVEVGETNVVSRMNELKAIVGGEGSNGGGIMYPSQCRDGLLSSIIIVRHLAKTGKSLTDLIGQYPRFYNLTKKVKIGVKPGFKQNLKNLYSNNSQVLRIAETGDDTGGLKIRFKDNSWVWYRASKTEPGLIRVIAESKDKNQAKGLLVEAADKLFIV